MRLSLVFLTLTSAILFSLAIPNELFHYGNGFLGMIALVPFFIAFTLSPGITFSSFLGILFALVNTTATYFWLLYFQDFSIWTISGVTFVYIIYFAIFTPIFSVFSKVNRAYRPFIIAAIWTFYEFFKSTGYLGFPWGLIAYPASNILPLIQIADIAGIWIVSFIIASINALVAETILQSCHLEKELYLVKNGKSLILHSDSSCFKKASLKNSWYVIIILTTMSIIYGFYRMNTYPPYDKFINIALIQQNTNSWTSKEAMNNLKIAQKLTRKSIKEAAEPIDLIVWSENAFREPYRKQAFSKRPKDDPFVPFLEEINIPLLAGSPVVLNWKKQEVMNAVVLISPDGEIKEYYGKQHPVPLAEHIPFWNLRLVKKIFKEVIGLQTAGWTLGTTNTLFFLPLESGDEIVFGVPICFEDSFPYICRNFIKEGADILINLTNDSWSKTISAETQHFIAARFRSIENKRILVRSSNAGVTTIIDPFGKEIKTLPLFKEGYLTAKIPVYIEDAYTPYTLFGDYFPIILAIILFIVLIKKRRV